MKPRVEVSCITCGETRTVTYLRSRIYINHNKPYKCRKCSTPRGEQSHQWKGGKVKQTCTMCGNIRYKHPGDPLSTKCFNCWKATRPQKEQNPNYKHIAITCSMCGTIKIMRNSQAQIYLQREEPYKCIQCYNKARPEPQNHPRWTGSSEKINIPCSVCGEIKQIRRKDQRELGKKGKAYRCLKCRPKGEHHPCWTGGVEKGGYPYEFKLLRATIRERDNHTCQLCATTENPRRMPVHHIDYDKQNCAPSNLITLCGSCHTKTNHKRTYWQHFFKERLS